MPEFQQHQRTVSLSTIK